MDLVVVRIVQRHWNGSKVLEQRQHFRIGCVIGEEETHVAVLEDGGDSNQTSSSSGNNTHVFIGVLGGLVLSVLLVVEVSHSLSEVC